MKEMLWLLVSKKWREAFEYQTFKILVSRLSMPKINLYLAFDREKLN
jgi:hypothetical protein